MNIKDSNIAIIHDWFLKKSFGGAEKVTLTVPNTTAAGVTIEADLTPFFVADTDILHFERKTQGAGGTTAGDGYYVVYYEVIPDSNGVA